MATDDPMSLTPKLRFPGFKSEWSNRPLSEVLREHGLKNDNGREVFSVSLEWGVVNQIDYLGRSFAAKDTSRYNKAKPHDITYTKSPLRDYPYGIVKQCKTDGDVALSPLYGVFSPANRHLGLMVEAYFDSPYRSKAFLAPLCQKGAKNTIQISNSRFLSGRLPLPTDVDEQRKIAECLGTLDELIGAESQKLDALKAHKIGLMQQLFPREGETLPRLRFPEFNSVPEWEEDTLTELCDFQDGFSFKSTDFTSEPGDTTQVIRITDINNRNKNADKVYVSNRFLETVNLRKYYAERGDLLLSLTGAAGFNFFVWDDDPALLNQRTTKITPKNADNAALIHLLAPLVHEKINARGEGQNNNLSREFLSTVVLRLPKPAEQHRIATCLSSLDELIAAQSDRLSALQTHKQGLLQQLFPSPEENEV